MIKLKVSPERASQLLGWIKHETFQEALDEHWVVHDGVVEPQSALWLFCWAKSGMNSVDVAHHVHKIFNEILDIQFETFDSKIPHEWAQEMRYAPGDISSNVDDLLNAPANQSK
jgi:hypothetical protein